MENLNDLIACCQRLGSEKVTERKKAVDLFRALLDNEKYTTALDGNSVRKTGFTWQRVFSSIEDYVNKETDYLLKDTRRVKLSSPQNTNAGRSRQPGSNMFKFVVRKANRREPMLKCSLLLSHILQILKNNSTFLLFGRDYCSVLLKDVLSVHTMWCDIVPDIWQELIELACKMYAKPDGVDRLLVLQIIDKIISHGSTKTIFNSKKLFEFFTQTTESLRNEESQTYVATFLSTLCSFSFSVASNHRFQLCTLGEKIIPVVIKWWNMKPSEQFKQSLINFLEIQMAAHHPLGVTNVASGACVLDEKIWQAHVLIIYKTLKSDIENLLSKHKFSSSKILPISPSLIHLMVRVCRQMSELQSENVSVSENENYEVSQIAAKRRKRQSPLEDIQTTIYQNVNDLNNITWLQLLSCWFCTYQDTLSPTALQNILPELHNLLVDCKKSLILEQILALISACVGCQEYLKSRKLISTEIEACLKQSWRGIYERVLRTFSLNQAKDQCLKLIKILLVKDLVTPAEELWWLFTSRQTHSPFLLEVLGAFIQRCELPKEPPRKISAIETPEEFNVSSKHSFRCYLLNLFLRPMIDEDGDLRCTLDISTVEILGQVLIALCLWSSYQFEINDGTSACCSFRSQEEIENIENLYLHSTFDLAVPHVPLVTENQTVLPNCDVSHSPEVLQLLLDILNRDSTDILDNAKKSEANHSVIICNYTCLILYVIRKLVNLKILETRQIYDLNIHRKVKLLFKFLMESILSHSGSKQITLMHLIVDSLLLLSKSITCENCDDIPEFVPEEMIDFVNSFFKTGISVNNLTNKSQRSHDENFAEEEEMDSDLQSRRKDNQNLLDPIILSPTEILYQHCSQFLVNFDHLRNTKKRIVDFMLDKEFNIMSTANLQLAVTMLSNIFQPSNQNINDDLLEYATGLLCKISKAHWKNMQVALKIFEVIAQIVPHLSGTSDDIRSETIKILQAFLKLYSQGKLGPQVQVGMIKCLKVIVQADPSNTWTSQSVENSPETIPTSLHLINMLKSDSFVVKFEAAKSVGVLINCNDFECLLSSDSVAMHKQTAQKAIEAVKTWNKLSTNIVLTAEDNELFWTKNSIFITTVTNLVLANPFVEKTALYDLFSAVSDYGIPIDMAKKAVDIIWKYFCYPNSEKYLDTHLDWIIHKWLFEQRSLSSFPYQLLDCVTFEDFLRKYRSSLVSWSAVTGNEAVIETFAYELNTDVTTLIIEYFPRIVALILPFIATNKRTSQYEVASSLENQSAVASYDFLEKFVTKECVNELLKLRFDDIVAELMFLLNEHKDSSLVTPTYNPLEFSKEKIWATVDHLKQKCFSEKETVISILTKDYSIHNIMLKLKINLMTSHRPFERFGALQIYKNFVLWLLQDISSLVATGTFIITNVIHTLVHVVTDHCDEVENSNHALDLLTETCFVSINYFSEQIGKNLPFLISSFVSVLSRGYLKHKIEHFIETVVVNNSIALSEFLRNLEAVPDIQELNLLSGVYQQLKNSEGTRSLKDDISSFLTNCDVHHGANMSRLDGLRHLKQQLAGCKEELRSIFNELLELRGFSEICETSLIHRLLTELIRLSSSSNSEVSLEAMRCLGEIGPITLPSLVLQVEQRPSRYKRFLRAFDNESLNQRNVIIFTLLSENLLQKDTELLKATVEVLKACLTSKAGRQFVRACREKNVDLFQYLQPFSLSDGSDYKKILVQLDDDKLWCPSKSCSCDVWIKNLVSALIASSSDEILNKLLPVARLQAKFCKRIFSFLIHALLSEGDDVIREVISAHITQFFAIHYENRTNYQNSIFFDKQALKIILDMINYLRLQLRPIDSKTPSWKSNFWLELNYLHVAIASEYCGANFSALLFFQIWCDSLIKSKPNENLPLDEKYSRTSNIMLILADREENTKVDDLLIRVYRSIGDSDGFYGLNIGNCDNPMKRIYKYELENQWNKTLAMYDRESIETPNCKMGVMKSLRMLGRTHTLETYMQGISKNDSNIEGFEEFQYECMWKNCQWSMPRQSASCGNFNQSIYNAVIDLIQQEDARFTKDVQNAYSSVLKNLKNTNLESTDNIYSALSQFQTLIQLEDFKKVRNGQEEALRLILKKWEQQDCFLSSKFTFIEPVITMQTVLLQVPEQSTTSYQALGERLLLKSKFARKSNLLDLAATYVLQLKKLKNLTQKLIWCTEIEEAEVLWCREETSLAIQKMRKLLAVFETDPSKESSLHSRALGLISKWLIETKSEIPHNIMQHLNQAVTVGSVVDKNSDLTEAYLAIGRYSDSNYQRITKYMDSDEFHCKLNLIKKFKEDAQHVAARMQNLNMDEKKSLMFLQNQKNMDEAGLNSIEEDKKLYLKQAINFYFACIRASDTQNLRVFSLISLWFQNSNNDEINKEIMSRIKQIGTHKFLPLMHQLSARISTSKNTFQKALLELIERMTSDHPHHTLFIILALSNAHKGESEAVKSSNVGADRIRAAEELLERLRKKRHLKGRIQKLERLCDAYISLSNYVGKERRQGAKERIPSKDRLLKLDDLDGISIPTDEIPVIPNADDSVPYILSFEPSYKLCGGINVPKVLTCLGSDGKKRTQLLKGQDDLRQDAVMQQVFGIVNTLLRQNSETRKRNLLIRTYKVVPLSQRSGIVQWCDGTQPFGDCVISCHARYHPNDLQILECRKKIELAAKTKPEIKLQKYMEVCCKCHPAFRYFFLENFLEPISWFERTLAYTKSVATSSIVGYILGLGDRHVANILIDNVTAEVIHIDFGVAFEQGKLLPIPEKVPFRLTRDVVDGMGVMGVEGVFRRSCEKTLDVLRQSQEIVLTLLEVLLYDPLYAWTMTIEKMAHLQESTKRQNRVVKVEGRKDENVNEQAKRALIVLQQKLQGVEAGAVLSVSGHVNHLIKEASDPKNLSALFCGWQAYL